ncbi:hypothetical protein [Variovorax paradoxus]|uniref:hypothetical protein n=1 Tax=Variovorax paradoxus TaxID=34073 RepID=UPI0027842390|nr:hypothetical protein [Variovorax paradoxus]MDP9933609.1 hypothetical protein [Variovorax paradoxus]
MTLNSVSARALQPRRDPPASGGDTEQRQLAWQREMERAQMTAWFKPSVAASDGGAVAPQSDRPGGAARQEGRSAGNRRSAPVGANGGDAVVSRTPLTDPVATGPSAGTGGGDMRSQPPRTMASAHARASTVAVTRVSAEFKGPTDLEAFRMEGTRPPAGLPATNDLAAPPSEIRNESHAKSSTPSGETQAPLRLHEETLPEGQAVWIAMRADDEALAAMLPQIVADLQRGLLQSRGQRLCQVVCNGRLVWRSEAIATMPGGQLYSGGNGRLGVFHPIQSKGA